MIVCVAHRYLDGRLGGLDTAIDRRQIIVYCCVAVNAHPLFFTLCRSCKI